MNIQAKLIEIGPNSNCMKMVNGDKELSISFKRINPSSGFYIESVGLFEQNEKDQFFNNVNGIGEIGNFVEWLLK